MVHHTVLKHIRRLADYLVINHFDGSALVGPDPGLRFNARLWRFGKSMLRWLPWADDRMFMQTQGYWIWCNWMLYEMLGEDRFQQNALQTTRSLQSRQTEEGYWHYPLPQWRGRIATVEGNYGALGCIESFRRTQDPAFLQCALQWFEMLINRIGFIPYEDTLTIRYFAGRSGSMIPNNTTLTLQFLAELYDITGEKTVRAYDEQMIGFLSLSQKESGELPYALAPPGEQGREHFLCYQYNAFQFIDLARTWELTKHGGIYDILSRLIRFLKTGQAPDGHCMYKCGKAYPEVTYYTAALGAAFLKAESIGLGAYGGDAERAFEHVLTRQNRRGGFVHSTRNYGILSDRRSYPRYLVMILKHLLMFLSQIENRGRNA